MTDRRITRLVTETSSQPVPGSELPEFQGEVLSRAAAGSLTAELAAETASAPWPPDRAATWLVELPHAELERARVETLRELTEVVDIRIRREYGVVDGDNDFSRGLYRATQILREERNKAIRHPLRADATTTGATDA